MEKASRSISTNLPAIACFAALIAYAAAMTMPQASVNQMGREFGVYQLPSWARCYVLHYRVPDRGCRRWQDIRQVRQAADDRRRLHASWRQGC